MKVIQIIPQFGMGGAEIMCENLVYALREQGVDVSVISLYDFQSPITERLEKKNIKVIYLDKKSGLDFSMIKKLKKVFKDEKPDVVHSHLNTQKYVIIAAKKANIPMRVHTVHSIADKELSKADKILARIFYKNKKVVPVALSDVVKQTIVDTYDISPDFVPTIFNGIDLSNCLPKEEYSIKDTIKILHIGRFVEVKNHIGLIKAFALFHKNYPNSQLQLIGDGEKKKEIEELIKEKGLTDSVEFLGLQDNVYKYLHYADIFTLPSLYEGVPMTLIEAMGTGLPIVATNVGGIPDMLINEESAILTAVDEQELANAFTRLAEDASLRKKIGERARKESLKFSSKEMARKYVELYENSNK